MGSTALDARSAWGIRSGDRVSVSEPVGGVCKPGAGAVGTITGSGEFREHTARFPLTMLNGSEAHVIVPYTGRGSEVELVRPSRIYRKM